VGALGGAATSSNPLSDWGAASDRLALSGHFGALTLTDPSSSVPSLR
jgi:hypothetical protein